MLMESKMEREPREEGRGWDVECDKELELR